MAETAQTAVPLPVSEQKALHVLAASYDVQWTKWALGAMFLAMSTFMGWTAFSINSGFALIEYRFDQLETRFIAVEERLTAVEDRLTAVEDRLTVVENRLTALEDRMTAVEDRLTALEDRVTGLEMMQQQHLQEYRHRLR